MDTRSATGSKQVNSNNSAQNKKIPKAPVLLVAIGTIIALGAVFILLASKQIFPSSINAISQLGAIGQGVGLGVLAVGGTLVSLSLFFCMLDRKRGSTSSFQGAVSTVKNMTMKHSKNEALLPAEEFPLKREELLQLKGDWIIPFLRNLPPNQAIYRFDKKQKNESHYQFYFRDSAGEIYSWRVKATNTKENEERVVRQFQTTHSGYTALETSQAHTPHIAKDDKISFEVKITLDELLGGFGTVDQLPVNEKKPFDEVRKAANEMITKGLGIDGDPYILINVRDPYGESQLREHDNYIMLRPNGNPLQWSLKANTESIEFFDAPFTNEKGEIEPSQIANFEYLKKTIKDGEGQSLKGFLWLFVKPHPLANDTIS